MGGEQGSLLGAELLDWVTHRGIVAAPPAGLIVTRLEDFAGCCETRSATACRRRGHQLDPVAARSDDPCPGGTPVFATAFDSEASLGQRREGALEVGDHD